jgi:tetratricopeptide (TPR) repeat protein
MQSHHEGSLRKVAASVLFALTLYAGAIGIVSGVPVSSNKAHDKGDKALRKGDYQLAEKIFRELLGKDSHDNDARLGLSFALLKQRILQDAYDHAARVLLLDPLSARAHALLGSAILAAGDFRNSVEEFRTSLALNQNEALAISGLAMVDFYENRLDLALPKLRRAASLDPDEPDYVFNLGQAAARSERYKEAADSYERFLAIAPKTDADRRARIRGLIDFLRYLGKQGSLYVVGGANRRLEGAVGLRSSMVTFLRLKSEKSELKTSQFISGDFLMTRFLSMVILAFRQFPGFLLPSTMANVVWPSLGSISRTLMNRGQVCG